MKFLSKMLRTLVNAVTGYNVTERAALYLALYVRMKYQREADPEYLRQLVKTVEASFAKRASLVHFIAVCLAVMEHGDAFLKETRFAEHLNAGDLDGAIKVLDSLKPDTISDENSGRSMLVNELERANRGTP